MPIPKPTTADQPADTSPASLDGDGGTGPLGSVRELYDGALWPDVNAHSARDFDVGAVAGASWWLLIFYSLAASVVTVWPWMTGLRHVPASSAGVFTVLLPVSAALVGAGLLGKRFSVAQAVAFALALLGVVLATWTGSAAAMVLRASSETAAAGHDLSR